MSSGMMGAAQEGPPPFYGGAPPDQQPMDLEGALQMVDSIIWRDGGMDKREQAIFGAWVQNTMMKAKAQQQQMAAMGGGPPSGLGSSGAGGGGTSEYNPFGGQGGSPIPGTEAPPY